MLTPATLKNPQRQSGYDHVGSAGGSRGKPPTQWRAQFYSGGRTHPSGGGRSWVGPCRKDPADAAQDYCDYVNGKGVAPSPKLKTDNHPKRPKRPQHPKEVEGRRLLREAAAEKVKDPSGWVYLMGEEGCNEYIKIGESSDDPIYRCTDGQTYNPRKLVILGKMHVPDRLAAEAALHAKFLDINHRNEWFRLTPEVLAAFPVLSSGPATLGA